MTGSLHPHWRNKENMKGVDVTYNRILEKVDDYLKRHQLNTSSKKSILITGHSRGAGIANLLGAYFEDQKNFDSYTYTFASPLITMNTKTSTYKTIFNVVNDDDLIPKLPMKDWSFNRYGVDKIISMRDNYENKGGKREDWSFEWFVDKDYNAPSKNNINKTINAFKNVSCKREDLYIIDLTSDGKVNIGNRTHISESGANARKIDAIKELEEARLAKYCNVTVQGGGFLNPYYVEVNYCPAFAVQVLANLAVVTNPLKVHDLKGKYASLKANFITTALGGMADPHKPITYYVIGRNNFKKFK